MIIHQTSLPQILRQKLKLISNNDDGYVSGQCGGGGGVKQPSITSEGVQEVANYTGREEIGVPRFPFQRDESFWGAEMTGIEIIE